MAKYNQFLRIEEDYNINNEWRRIIMGTKERLMSGEYQPDTYLLYETSRIKKACSTEFQKQVF